MNDDQPQQPRCVHDRPRTTLTLRSQPARKPQITAVGRLRGRPRLFRACLMQRRDA
jgi:hypothetical protein